MKKLFPLLAFLILSSCIPIKIAPNIKDDRLMVAEKFDKSLTKDYALIFEDPKHLSHKSVLDTVRNLKYAYLRAS